MRLLPFALSSLLALAAGTALAQTPPAAPVSALVERVNIPYQTFTLGNGLKVIVHEDHKAPIVAVSIWYHVGSKDEPAGETGFAHLYEHLMFYGSENVPGQFFEQLESVGATDWNGNTWFDRTNYFETVPKPALSYALFLESDRMGHLLGAIDQKRLDLQRGVVQNEKRQDDNEPYGLVEYSQLAALFPEGHPYHHETIGSMADLDAASLGTVKNWFRQHYGPNNAVLVLAGDITPAEARPLVEKYFGDIPRGPQTAPAAADVPALAAPKSEVLHDQVATTRLYRDWAVPGYAAPELVPLDVASSIIGGLASSRLDNILVRQEKLAVGASAGVEPFERVGLFEITVDVKPGVDPAVVGKRLDAILADFMANGPTAAEVQRAVTSEVANRIRGLESVGGSNGKAAALAQGELYAGDADFYRKQLAAYAALTPADVRDAARKWLGRPVYALTVEPGPRGAYEESKSQAAEKGPGGAAAGAAPPPTQAQVAQAQQPKPTRVAPPVGEIVNLSFPKVEHAKLSNGVPVIYAHRDAVPVTQLSLSFDAGNAADPKSALGTQSLMLALLDEGTATRSSEQIAEEKERLGADIGAGASMDRTNVSLSALSANLAPSLDLLTDIVRNAAFAPAEVERLRVQQLSRIKSEMSQPIGIALRTLPPMLYGAQHPYGVPFTGTGDPAAVAKVSREDLVRFKQDWLKPGNLKIFIVSDRPLGQLMPLLDRSFGTWGAGTASAAKDFAAPTPAPRTRIVLIDRPNAPQSLILAGELLPGKGREELAPLLSANDVLGGSTVSRLTEDLRESKGWAYGAQSFINRVYDTSPFMVYAPVQTDKTGESIAALRADMTAFLTTQGVTPAELKRTVANSIRELPGAYETGGDVLGGMQRNDLYQRPDDYYSHLADLYRTFTAAQLDQVARAAIDPGKLVWVVVGDAAKVRPQLDKLGLPVETMTLQ